jgi:hypothetical protein
LLRQGCIERNIGQLELCFDHPASIEDMSVRMATFDIDFLDGDKIVLPSRKGITISPPESLSGTCYLYTQKIDLNPEWKQFLEKSVDTIRITLHYSYEKG